MRAGPLPRKSGKIWAGACCRLLSHKGRRFRQHSRQPCSRIRPPLFYLISSEAVRLTAGAIIERYSRGVHFLLASGMPKQVRHDVGNGVRWPVSRCFGRKQTEHVGLVRREKAFNFLLKHRPKSGRSRAKNLRPCGSVWFAGQWPCAAKKLFLLT